MMNEEQKPAAVTDPSIHHAANFHPEDYEVLDYLDNQPPRFEEFAPFFGAPTGSYEAARQAFEGARAFWAKEMDSYFPHRHERQPSIHHCTHCGNGTVRYIVAVRHNPTGQNVVFGSDCVARLGFANQSDFKAAQVRSRAEAGNARMAAYAARVKFLAGHPEVQAAIDDLTKNPGVHERNDFARDILSKFNHYGGMSDRQAECFVSSLQRDHEFAAKRAAQDAEVKGPVPVGRQEFDAEILSVQQRESRFGPVTKILVKLENNSKVWMTLPSSASGAERGNKMRFRATVEASKDGPSFGFGKRPTVVEHKEAVAQ
jgi:hypothetical protein